MKKYLALLSLAIFSMSVNAASITDKQFQTTSGQLFTHNLNGPAADGLNGGTLTVHTRGDFYAGGQHNENYSVSIDGNVLGSGLSFDSVGAFAVTEHSFNDTEFSFSFAIDASLMSAIMSDLLAVVSVDFGAGMDAFDPAYFSEVTLDYNNVSAVPVPAAAFLFAPALLGFLGLRKKANNRVA